MFFLYFGQIRGDIKCFFAGFLKSKQISNVFNRIFKKWAKYIWYFSKIGQKEQSTFDISSRLVKSEHVQNVSSRILKKL